MKMMNALGFGAALALAGGTAQARQGMMAPADPQTQSPADPASPAAGNGATAPAGRASVTDTEVRQFASAAMAVNDIQKDGGLADAEKQTKILAAVQQSGLSPQRFNEIAQASRSDSGLMQRVQAAATAPGQSRAPGASGERATPATPATPAMPGTPGTPATPTEPVTPATPAAPHL